MVLGEIETWIARPFGPPTRSSTPSSPPRSRAGRTSTIAAASQSRSSGIRGTRRRRVAAFARPDPAPVRFIDAATAEGRARSSGGDRGAAAGRDHGRRARVPIGRVVRGRGRARDAGDRRRRAGRRRGDRRWPRRARRRRLRRDRGPVGHARRAVGSGGQASSSPMLRNYLGFPAGVTGAELTARAFQQAITFGATLRHRPLGDRPPGGGRRPHRDAERRLGAPSRRRRRRDRGVLPTDGHRAARGARRPGRVLRLRDVARRRASRASPSTSSAARTPPARRPSTSPATPATSRCSSAAASIVDTMSDYLIQEMARREHRRATEHGDRRRRRRVPAEDADAPRPGRRHDRGGPRRRGLPPHRRGPEDRLAAARDRPRRPRLHPDRRAPAPTRRTRSASPRRCPACSRPATSASTR